MSEDRQRVAQQVLSSKLVTKEQLTGCLSGQDGHAADARGLLVRLVRQGLLTKWQAEQIRAGKVKGFFVGHYKLLTPLGAGGMGHVFQAVDTRLNRMVAIKLLSQRSAPPGAVERFRREAKASLELQHENIVRTFELGQHGSTPYLVMEYVQGTNLRDVIRVQKRLSVEVTARIGHQVSLALEHARLHGIIHRDIKPANILLGRDGNAKLADLGLAKFFGQRSDAQTELTKTGFFMGTVDYCAPEQAEDAKRADTSSDIYSLGCTLYHCLTGQPPFADGTEVQKIVAHREREPDRIETLNPDVPEGLANLIHQDMLAKRPMDRFPTPADAANAFLRWIPGAQVEDPYSIIQSLVEEELSAEALPRPDRTVARASDTAAGPPRTLQELAKRKKSRSSPMSYADDGSFTLFGGIRLPANHPLWLWGVIAGAALLVGLLLSGFFVGLWSPSEEMERSVATGPIEPPDMESDVAERRVETDMEESQSVPLPAEPSAPPPLANAPFDESQAKQYKETWADHLGVPVEITNSIGMKFVLIPPGQFMMGSPESEEGARDCEHPQHQVRINRPFFLGVTEVTQGQWEAVMGTRPWSGKGYVKEGSDYAAPYVSWDDAQSFCERLSEKERVTCRLPTEAEWEYACRAGTTTVYHFGDDASRLGDYARFRDNAVDVDEKYAHRVGHKKPNPVGLYDMHGNVAEWCQDWLASDYYAESPTDDPTGPVAAAHRAIRGGCWWDDAKLCRAASRLWYAPQYQLHFLGFRVALSPPIAAAAEVVDVDESEPKPWPPERAAPPAPADAALDEAEAQRGEQSGTGSVSPPAAEESIAAEEGSEIRQFVGHSDRISRLAFANALSS